MGGFLDVIKNILSIIYSAVMLYILYKKEKNAGKTNGRS